MEFTVFQTAQEEEKRRVAGTPGEKDQRNKNHYLFNSGDLLHSVCRGRVGSGHKAILPVISPFDICWRVTAAAVAFYCWKAKAENLLKIKAAYPELSGTLSDFSRMTQ